MPLGYGCPVTAGKDKRMTGRGWFKAGLASLAALGLAACDIAPAVNSAEELESHFRDTYGEHIVEVPTVTNSQLPWLGSFNVSLILSPTTPPEVLDEIYTELMEYPGTWRVSVRPGGVMANGVGICADDPDQGVKRALRQALYEADHSLHGTIACLHMSPYLAGVWQGSWEDYVVDTALVQGLPGQVADVELTAKVPVILAEKDEVKGEFNGPWSQIAGLDGVVPALVAARQAGMEFSSFNQSGADLTIPIRPTGTLEHGQEAATAAAAEHSDELQVHLVLGSADPTEQAIFALSTPLVDDLREVASVGTIKAAPAEIRVGVHEAEQVPPVYAVLRQHPDVLDTFTIIIGVLAEGDVPRRQSVYTRVAGAEESLEETFLELLTTDGVEAVRVSEARDGEPAYLTITVTYAEDPVATAASLKPLLPEGSRVAFNGLAERGALSFDAADQLDVEDVEMPSLPQDPPTDFIEAWNATSR